MKITEINDHAIDTLLLRAEKLMASGKWGEAESIIRECCINQADMNLRLVQLKWRRECAEYASGLDWYELGREGVFHELDDKFGVYAAEWVVNQYKLTPKGLYYGNEQKTQG